MPLTIDVFNSGYLPVNGGPGWNPNRTATWPASTATLIAGRRDAILVDALMTIDEAINSPRGSAKAARTSRASSSRTVTAITSSARVPLLATFPAAQLVALNAAVVDEASLLSYRGLP